jgi:hypothetical protein
MPILGIMASQISGHLWSPEGAYDALATVTLSASTASVSFVGIPSGYKHLQIRMIARTDRSANEYDGTIIQFNSDTGSNYAYHRIIADGSTVTSDGYASQTNGNLGTTLGGGAIANAFSPLVTDILDYANANKYKTVRSLSGRQNNTTDSNLLFTSSLWMNTAAVTSIILKPSVGPNFVTYSSFALFGVK